MKRKLLHLFAVCMAIVTAIPIANAAASDYKINAPTKNWTTTFTTPNPNSRQPTVSADGQLFVLSDADKYLGTLAATYRINSSGSQLVNLGMTYTGSANAFDDSGNYIFHGAGSGGPAQSPTTNPPTKYIVRTFDKTNMTDNSVFPNYKGIDMSTHNPGRIGLYCDATGNVYGGTGYLWFAQTGTNTKITAITISSGTATGKKDFDTGIVSGGGNDNYLNFYDTSDKTAMKCILQVRGVGIYDVTLNHTAGTVTSVKEIPCTANEEFNSLGAHIFMLRGRKLLCRNTRRLGSTGTQRNCYSEFEILDITDCYTNPTKIATLDHMPGKYTDYNTYDGHNTGSFVVSHKVSDNEVTLYAYVAGAGCSSYKITASAITAPVSNLKAEIVSGTANEVKVSWGAPSQGKATKYAISYSINGGAWSADEELTATSKTYSNQADATYKFRVRAYFGGSSTWGAYTETNSVTVVNYNKPVTNLHVQTNADEPYKAVLSWDLPAEGTPSKYAVSYSTNGGSTWSTAVETTDKTKTLTDLAPGQYIFKVTPYYSMSWGVDETVSATVYGVTEPVSNVDVAYVGNTGNSIVVSWGAPNATVVPNKYQVCYSTDEGASWSTPVETADLTYTFSDLAEGKYTFKVTPLYNGLPGNDTQSGVIEVIKTGLSFTTTKLWEVQGALTNSEGGFITPMVAVSNNNMYVAAPTAYGSISYVSEGLGRSPESWPNFPSGYDPGNYGFGMDNDEAGNIVVKTGNYYGSAATQLTIYPAGATSNAGKKEITLSGDYLPGGRADFITAQGNLLSDEGGYVWIVPNDKEIIKRIKIVNGKLAGVDSWTQTFAATTNQNQIIARPLPDGRLYIQHRGNEYKIINLPAPGTEITSNMIERIPTTGTVNPYGMVSSDMFMLQGNIFHVRNDGAKNQSIGIVIKNLTEKDKEGNGDAAYTPFNGIDTKGNENGASGSNGYGSFVRAVKVDDYNYDVYSYSPGHGVTVYRVSAKYTYVKTDELTSLTYKYVQDSENNTLVQNIELAWVAPDEATPSSYKIYRNGSLIKTVDGSTLTYTDKGVTQNYTYKVVPIFIGANENASLGLEVTTTEVKDVLYAPEITEVRNYDGYSIVEIFWQMPSYNKTKPVYYNIYRNGVLLETGMTQYNYIDDQLPKISDKVEYTYTVEAVYGATQNNATRTSEEETVLVAARDWSLSGYQLQEVYNIPISPVIGNLPNNFTNEEYYRQGHFYNGSWYIAQLSDQLSRKDQGVSGGAVNQSGIEGATGGVVSIKATEEADIHMGFSDKVLSSEEFASVGLAMDDKGVIFMRHNNISKLEATVPTGSNWVSWLYDAFDRRITEGALYVPDANGNYSSDPTHILDLSALWLDNRWIDDMYFTGAASNGQVKGRSDYFYMYGDVMSTEGGFLLISPSWTRTIFKVKVANGEYVNHETHEINEYQDKNGMVDVTVGTGNYGFKLDGRNAWIAQLRSSGYFGIHGEEDNHEEGHEHTTHAIFVAESRINNTGGTSIVAFNSAEGANDGETFLITPSSMYSRNYGDFIVTRGTKAKPTDPASEAKFMPPMPVAQIKQTNINTNVNTNASGNWFHAEVGTYVGTSGKEEECVYIYQYVPGVRFAKYRLVSDLSLPVVTPTLEIKTAYNDNGTDITHFDGIVKWERPQGFGITNTDEASVWIKSYTVELVDAMGNVVETVEVKSDIEDENGKCEFDYFEYLAGLGKSTSDCELDYQTYTARVAVNYELKNGDIQQSSFNYASASNNYDAAPATSLSKWMFKGDGTLKVYVWVEQDGEWVIVEKPVDVYRVELDFNKPDNNITDEPVSYYTIKAYVNDKKDVIQIKDFHLHKGVETVNGVNQAILDRDEKGNVIPTSQIPGDYDFDTNKAPYYRIGDKYGSIVNGQSVQKSVLTWHHKVPKGYYTGGVATVAEGDEEAEEIIITDEPIKWTFVVEAHYAASNRSITKIEEAQFETAPENEEFIQTSIEVVGDNASALKIYPIPATTSITVKAPEAINSIVVYNEAGVEVINEMGNGENIATVNVENLATGFYFVKVNNYEPVKIAKK